MRTTLSVILFLLISCSALHGYGQQQPPPKQNDTMLLKIDSLRAAVVTATMRPRVKGDTLIYNTEHILLRKNALVEELLRRLPGLQISPDGTITYNGDKIEHLLVDGEDIFGSDPTTVTRNFDASKIARVEILDRKSDQAIFTGIDDGTRTRTLNLVLKPTAKDGYFGKVDAGGNTDGFYNVDGVVGSFENKEQFTVLGLASNTGILGFTNNEGNSPASVNFSNVNADPLYASAGAGIPRFVAGGFHYANTWAGSEDHLTANYQYSHYFTNPLTTGETVETQPGTIYRQLQQSQSTNSQDYHRGFGNYDWKLGERTAFRFFINAGSLQGQNQFAASAIGTFNDSLVNSSERSIRDIVSHQNFSGGLDWRLQIGKNLEQVLSVGASLLESKNKTDGYLYSINRFYPGSGGDDSADTIDQRKQLAEAPLSTTARLGYVQPFSRHVALAFQYSYSTTVNSPLQATFDRGDGKYQEIVDSLTSNLRTQAKIHRAMITLQGKAKKFSYTIGNEWIAYDYRQHDLLADSLLHVNYFNWAPRVLFSYAPNNTAFINFNYNSFTRQPTMAELQPVRNNTNPLLITLGNPALRPALNQDFRLEFHRLKTWLLYLTLDVTLVNNDISTKTTTDNLGRQISQPVNVDGTHNASLYFTASRKVLGWDAGVHAAGFLTHAINYVNTDINQNDAYTAAVGMSLNKFLADKFAFQLNANFAYFDQVSSINPSAPIRYWTQSHQGSVSFYFIPHFEINTNATYTWQQRTSAFTGNTSVLLWNAYLSRNFIHDKLVLKFLFNNMLNADAGITRTNTANINTESSTNILGRYWMLSAAWHFDKKFTRH